MHNSIKEIRIEKFSYELPEERIAKYPVEQRDSSQLLVYRHGECSTRHFYDIHEELERGDLLIYNNTRVIHARLHFQKETGASVEIFCLEPHAPADYAMVFQTTASCEWECLVGNSKKWKEGPLNSYITIKNDVIELTATRVSKEEGMSNIIRFEWDNDNFTFGELLEHFGELPIPPYLNRKTEASDLQTYQTVYSRVEGSVAAPTAGLHFTKDVLRRLVLLGVNEDEVTLHVGAGTFQPVKSETIGDHPMHKETISVRKQTIELLIKNIGHVVAVGTTSVRTLESLYYIGLQLMKNDTEREILVGQWEPYETSEEVALETALQAIVDYLNKHHLPSLEAETRIIIVPSYKFRIVNKLITNFHQPKSTLLLLIAAFVGEENWRTIYDYALANNYRFLSYGDSSLLIP